MLRLALRKITPNVRNGHKLKSIHFTISNAIIIIVHSKNISYLLFKTVMPYFRNMISDTHF